ncbi:MAG: YmfQ family protein [Oscillospiraceae bacterium]|nr:YmfQ family protein [Oscillospiraceae bacterium]
MPETQICKYYPPWFRRILDFQALCQTEGAELDAMAEAMSQIHRNLFVQTMDEGTTAQWEAILRILPTPEETLEFRRLRVQNRLSLRPPFTLIFLRKKLDLIFGPGNYTVEVDYPNYTLYIEAPAAEQAYFSEVSALLNIIKPCHIVYISRPRLDSGLLLSERVCKGKTQYNYILGMWRLGEKPFAGFEEQEVLKLETTPSIRPALLNQTAAFVAADVASVRVNGSILITALSRATSGNVGSVTYPVRRDQTEGVTLSELLDKDGNVLSASAVAVPVLDEQIELRHSFTIKEGT